MKQKISEINPDSKFRMKNDWRIYQIKESSTKEEKEGYIVKYPDDESVVAMWVPVDTEVEVIEPLKPPLYKMNDIPDGHRITVVNQNVPGSEKWNEVNRKININLFEGAGKEEMDSELKKLATNFMQVIPDSQSVQSLDQILMQLEGIHRRTKCKQYRNDVYGPIIRTTSIEEDVKYIVTAIKNSINQGYKMVKEDGTK